MSGDVTYQALERLTYMPDRDASDNGLRIAGQYYYDVYFTGGQIDNVTMQAPTLNGATLNNPIINGATLGGFTPSRAMISDGSGILSVSTITTTELGYSSGLTSNIQTQLNAKQGTLTLTTTGSSGAATLIGNTLNIPNYTVPSITPAALTKSDDTNVTLTLGGTPTTALLQATSLTLGWTGTLSVARGGIGVGTLTGIAKGNGTGAFTAAVQGTDYYAPGGTDVALADGGTGASYASNAALFAGIKQNATTAATGVVQLADQAAMEAETSGRAATADVLKYHPGVAKFWVFCTLTGGVPAVTASYNVSSITDDGAGLAQINFTTSFSSANYAVVGTGMDITSNSNLGAFTLKQDDARTAGNCPVQTTDSGGNVSDLPQWYSVGFGDQ